MGGPPAALAALLAALVLVLPLFSADETGAVATPRGWSAYLRSRFGTRAAPNLAKFATLLAWLAFAVSATKCMRCFPGRPGRREDTNANQEKEGTLGPSYTF